MMQPDDATTVPPAVYAGPEALSTGPSDAREGNELDPTIVAICSCPAESAAFRLGFDTGWREGYAAGLAERDTLGGEDDA